MHVVPVLWRFHAVHHSANDIDFLVNTRAHPFDIVLGRLCGIVPLYVLGLAGPTGAIGAGMPVLVVFLGTVWGYFIHSNLRLRFGPLAWVVSTPAFHHWHHAFSPTDKNFASLLPVLDRVFGTYHAPPNGWPVHYGTNDPIPASLPEQLVHPFLPSQPSAAEAVRR
jgi:sterol desaturase/sphingolipid hydroxylase (fatty acid hydroxylase superfamily)